MELIPYLLPVPQTLLTSMGQAFGAEEVSAMERFAADEQGRIYYERYAYQLANDGRA